MKTVERRTKPFPRGRIRAASLSLLAQELDRPIVLFWLPYNVLTSTLPSMNLKEPLMALPL